MNLKHLLCALPLFLAACTGGCLESLWSRLNAGAFERYSRQLVARSGRPLAVERCAMFGTTRLGYCLLSGSVEETAAFLDSLPLSPEQITSRTVPPPLQFSCAGLPEFGQDEGTRTNPGVRRLEPAGPLPPNKENVRLRTVVVDAPGRRVCLQYEFPFG